MVKRDCGSTGVCDLKDDAWDWLGGQDRSRARTAATRTEKTREKKICRDCSGLFLSVGAWPGNAAGLWCGDNRCALGR